MRKLLMLAFLTTAFALLHPAMAQQAAPANTQAAPVSGVDMDQLRARARQGDVDAQRRIVEELGRRRKAAEEEKKQDDAAFRKGAITWLQPIGLLLGYIFILLGTQSPMNNAYWRQQAERTEGTIVGVEVHWYKKTRMYRTVYKYKLSNGREYIGPSDLPPESGTKGRETGTILPLLVFPERPRRARPADYPVWDAGYILCLLIGLGICYGVLSTATPVMTTWYVVGAMIALVLARALHFFTLRDHPFPADDGGEQPPAPALAAAFPDPAQMMRDKEIGLHTRQGEELMNMLARETPYYPIEEVLKKPGS